MTELLRFQDPELIQRELTHADLEALLRIQTDFVDRLRMSNGIESALKKLCQHIESLVPNTAASIMQFASGDERLAVRVAPSLAPSAIADLNGLSVGEGSCGNAIFHNKPMYVCDTSADVRWENIRDFAYKYRVKSCWSAPVTDGEDKPIGTFALSSFTEQIPDSFHASLLKTATQLVSMALIREDQERKLHAMAHSDKLTGLANRAMLDLSLDHAIERAHRRQSSLTVMFMDLDGFKAVNDYYGHEFGDQILKSVATHMDEVVGGEHFLARFGGDEFVVLVDDSHAQNQVHDLAEQLREAVGRAARDHKISRPLGLSFGISRFPDDGENAADLIRLADSAMFERKLFSSVSTRANPGLKPHTTTLSNDALVSEQQLDEFNWYFRIQMDENDIPVGLRTVLTWQHPEQGRVVVDSIKPKLLNSLFYQRLIEDLVAQLEAIKANPQIVIPTVTIPISTPLLHTDLINSIAPKLNSAGFSADDIYFGISESDLEQANVQQRDLVRRLARAGYRIQLDGFGLVTGALNRLRCLAPARICLSSNVVETIGKDAAAEALARSLWEAAASFDMEVMAEGLQSEAQRNILIDIGYCRFEGGIVSPLLSVSDLNKIFASSE